MPSPHAFRIRLIHAGDAASIQSIQTACYPPELRESSQSLLAKSALSPQSCWLAENDHGAQGYLFTHPWHDDAPPALNHPLDGLPNHANIFFLHDLAIHPASRGQGIAQALIRRALAWAQAENFRQSMLVAVQDSQAFWQRHGFSPRAVASSALQEKLKDYGPDASCLMAKIESQ